MILATRTGRAGFCFVLLCSLTASLSSCRRPFPTAPDREAIAQTVAKFHDALATGDRTAAMALLAPDVVILETGHRQNRDEYAEEHLAADIEFARSVPSKRDATIVRQEGAVAWTSVTSRSVGKFRGKDVDTDNAELMGLAKNGEGWQIRAIHWSGHSHRAGE